MKAGTGVMVGPFACPGVMLDGEEDEEMPAHTSRLALAIAPLTISLLHLQHAARGGGAGPLKPACFGVPSCAACIAFLPSARSMLYGEEMCIHLWARSRQTCIALHYPIMRSMLDGEEMRQEMERLKESDAITEAIREFGKVGGRALVVPCLGCLWCRRTKATCCILGGT